MDKETRNAIERATQRARKILEDDFAAQLEGSFDVLRAGTIAATAGPHLSARQIFQREKIVASLDHKRAAGMTAAEAISDYLRDAAFTTLNRFVALKMLEARDLVQECITRGEDSGGYREFCGMAAGVTLLPEGAGYRLFLESLFDELSTEVKVLFDRRGPASALWPKRVTFDALLDVLNAMDLANVWGEDETVGWVYQFFNTGDERRVMRDASQAPRNSRELAVRNQFFTPRYVVQFLADNTLGRIWYEMRAGETALVDHCEYMVHHPEEKSAARIKKDPRDLRVLDPACGSGHFLLYAFDLLIAIYEEAHRDLLGPKSEVTGNTLATDFPNIDHLRRALPTLILAHNLHGVDIDPRCAQIAQLALWMRAQRAFRDFGIGRSDRPMIRRSNIVVAEPLVTDGATLEEFLGRLGDATLGHVFKGLANTLTLAGELGLLLRVELLTAGAPKLGRTGDLFAPPEARIRAALERFVEDGASASTRRRLFVDDSAHGIGLLETAEKKFDVVLMNPPFGDPSTGAKEYVFSSYRDSKTELYAAFIDRAVELAPNGLVGCLTSRTGFFLTSLERWRRNSLLRAERGATVFLDLGDGVLDAAVECACVVIGESGDSVLCGDATGPSREGRLSDIREAGRALPNGWIRMPRSSLSRLPGATFAYRLPAAVVNLYTEFPSLAERGFVAKQGIGTSDNFRFLRLRWEVTASNEAWLRYSKGGGYSPYFFDSDLVLNWRDNGAEVKAYSAKLYGTWSKQITNTQFFGKPGLTYSSRTHREFAPAIQPVPSAFDTKGCCIFGVGDVPEPVWLALLGVTNSRMFSGLLRVGLARASAGLARQYNESLVLAMPMPDLHRLGELTERVREAHGLHAAIEATRETASVFEATPWLHILENEDPLREIAAFHASCRATWQRQVECAAAVDKAANAAYFGVHSVPDAVLTYLDAEVGSMPKTVIDAANSGFWNPLRNSQFFGDDEGPAEALRRFSRAALSTAFGAIAGRWLPTRTASTAADVSESWRSPSDGRDGVICVDDEGHPADVLVQLQSLFVSRDALDRVAANASERRESGVRSYIREEFLGVHIQAYSSSKRRAPVYWQLTTPSASYSVWLYLHALTKDTVYKVQNDYVAPKLAHEERRLESLRREGQSSSSAERKILSTQEIFVDELRTLLDEIKRVAPLWNPHLDDGVIINFAPLWRLVPHHKAWQKDLKSTWDALCAGDYDWAHLAMHLWPERVVPKCTIDRSLAVAHGLEDVLWIEGADGKWKARATPARPIDELIHERTSPAVKAALKSLLDAPIASGNARARGRRTASPAATETGSR